MNKFDKAIKRFETCKYSDKRFCRKIQETGLAWVVYSLMNLFLGNYVNEISTNAHSIYAHCGKCKYYEERKK